MKKQTIQDFINELVEDYAEHCRFKGYDNFKEFKGSEEYTTADFKSDIIYTYYKNLNLDDEFYDFDLYESGEVYGKDYDLSFRELSKMIRSKTDEVLLIK